MKKIGIVCLVIFASYVFSCLLLSQQVAWPWEMLHYKYAKIESQEIMDNRTDLLLVEDHTFLSESTAPYIEIAAPQKVQEIKSITIGLHFPREKSTRTHMVRVYFAKEDQDYSALRMLEYPVEGGRLTIVFPAFARDDIDKIRIQPTTYQNMYLELAGIELNREYRFSLFVFLPCILFFGLILVNDWRCRKSKEGEQT